jgi:hypothetical protein
MSRCLSKRFFLAGLLLLLLALISSPTLHPQAVSIASVTGRVADPSGAIVPNAQVQITAVNTGIVHKAVSDAGGNYSFPSLPIGPYTLEVTAPGFQTYLQSGIVLQVNDAVQINV